MAEFKSDEVIILASPEAVFNKVSDPENFRRMVENADTSVIPDDKREMLEKIEVTDDGITVPGGPMGAVKLRFAERVSPSLVKLTAEGSPVPIELSLHLKPEGDNDTRAQVAIDIEVPMMMRMMVAKPLTKLVNDIARLLPQIPF